MTIGFLGILFELPRIIVRFSTIDTNEGFETFRYENCFVKEACIQEDGCRHQSLRTLSLPSSLPLL